VLAAVSRRYPEPRGRFPRVTHPCATDGRNHPCDLHVLSAPPAFVLSQDQTLSFIPAPTGQKRSPKPRRAETRHARDPSRRCQSRQPTAAACTSPLTQPPTMRKSAVDDPSDTHTLRRTLLPTTSSLVSPPSHQRRKRYVGVSFPQIKHFFRGPADFPARPDLLDRRACWAMVAAILRGRPWPLSRSS
jgi:hypothetical protein